MKKLLDLYSGAGLAAIGYQQAGFHVTGVDIETKSCYAGNTFIQADALQILMDVKFCQQFDAIHASPPCQKYSQSTAMFRLAGKQYGDYIPQTRFLLNNIGKPYIIENVPTAPVRPDIVLHGWMFGLNVMRKRHFELGGGLFHDAARCTKKSWLSKRWRFLHHYWQTRLPKIQRIAQKLAAKV